MAGMAGASTIHTWASGDTVNAADLNANFNHIHNTMVGGHGARLVNADVSSTAAVAHSKLATPALVPKAWAYVASCGADPCTIGASSGVTTINRAGAGHYQITLTANRLDALYGVLLTARGAGTFYCTALTLAATPQHIDLQCQDAAGTAADTGFTIMILDNA